MKNCAVEYLKQVLCESQVELPTLALQKESLFRFMAEVGYSKNNPQGTSFVYKGSDKMYPKELSWKSAVVLHNCGYFCEGEHSYLIPLPYSSFRPCSPKILVGAIEAKIVKTVYLQWNKRKKHWQVSTNRIKFNEAYFNG